MPDFARIAGKAIFVWRHVASEKTSSSSSVVKSCRIKHNCYLALTKSKKKSSERTRISKPSRDVAKNKVSLYARLICLTSFSLSLSVYSHRYVRNAWRMQLFEVPTSEVYELRRGPTCIRSKAKLEACADWQKLIRDRIGCLLYSLSLSGFLFASRLRRIKMIPLFYLCTSLMFTRLLFIIWRASAMSLSLKSG